MTSRIRSFALIVAASTLLFSPGAEETTPTLTCFETWRRGRIERAIERLRAHDTVDGSYYGFSTAPPGLFYRTSLTLLRFATRDECLALLRDAHPVVRVLGAYGVLQRGEVDTESLLEPLRTDHGRLHFRGDECVMWPMTVAQMVAELERVPQSLARDALAVQTGYRRAVVLRELAPAFDAIATEERFRAAWRAWWLHESPYPRTLADLRDAFPGVDAADLVAAIGRMTHLEDADELLVSVLANPTEPDAVRRAAADALGAHWRVPDNAALLECLAAENSGNAAPADPVEREE